MQGEHPTATHLKLKILEMYNGKLDERERRKQFVKERGLLDYRRQLVRPNDENRGLSVTSGISFGLLPGLFHLTSGRILYSEISIAVSLFQPCDVNCSELGVGISRISSKAWRFS